MSSTSSAKHISGSIIQNSAKCRAVWLFSALKVGPKVYYSRWGSRKEEEEKEKEQRGGGGREGGQKGREEG
jgi:hypothetical protein